MLSNKGGIMNPLILVNIVSRLAILAVLLPASMLAAQNPDSSAITKLLSEVKTHAAQADDDAHTLASFTQSKLHRRTHGIQLERIKQHVNDLIHDANELSSMRDEGSPWQQEAVDHISGLLPEMAAHMTTTINHLNDNQNRIQMKPYQDLLLTNETIIHIAHEIISDYVDYGEAKTEADALEKDLKLSEVTGPAS
jgi:hypothetical protein